MRTSRWGIAVALRTWQWWALWLILFLNTSAGIPVISQESPMFQEFAAVGAVAAAGIYGLMLTAWGTASAFGPLLIAYMRQATGS